MASRLRLSVPAATISFPLKSSVLVAKGISPQPQGIPVNIPLHIKCLRTEYGQRHIHIRHRHRPRGSSQSVEAICVRQMGKVWEIPILLYFLLNVPLGWIALCSYQPSHHWKNSLSPQEVAHPNEVERLGTENIFNLQHVWLDESIL